MTDQASGARQESDSVGATAIFQFDLNNNHLREQ